MISLQNKTGCENSLEALLISSTHKCSLRNQKDRCKVDSILRTFIIILKTVPKLSTILRRLSSFLNLLLVMSLIPENRQGN